MIAPTPPGRLSTRGWTALRRSVTVAVFALTTVIGVTLGIRGVELSPVATAIAAAGPAVVQEAVPATDSTGADSTAADQNGDGPSGGQPSGGHNGTRNGNRGANR